MSKAVTYERVADLLFNFYNLAFFFQTLEPIRVMAVEKNKCKNLCNLMTNACPSCIEGFCKTLEEGNLSFDNRVFAIYQGKETPKHHLGCSLFNFEGQMLYGNIDFASHEMVSFFNQQMEEKRYNFVQFNKFNPYTTLFWVHEDDSSLNCQEEKKSKLKKMLSLYYLFMRAHVSAESVGFFNNLFEAKREAMEQIYTGRKKNEVNVFSIGGIIKEFGE